MTRLRQWFARAGSNMWSDWPAKAYARAGYQQRLAAVERHLGESLDLAPGGPVRIASMCAGDGRDVLRVVKSHPRRSDVVAWLVELSGNSVADGAAQARVNAAEVLKRARKASGLE